MRFWGIGAVMLLAATTAGAQGRGDGAVDYRLSFPNAAHHEADIVVTFRDVPAGPLEVRMARSSPGRYAIHEFAKNVYSVSAIDGAGRPLPLRRSEPYGWTVERHDGTVRFHYTLFADRGDGTYSQVNRAHHHLNMPSTMAFAPALAGRPVTVSIKPFDPAWKVATQLAPDGPGRWRARDLQYLMDSPIEIAPLQERTWQSPEQGRNYAIRLMVHSADSTADVDRYAAMAEKVYRAQLAMWGDVPNFDHGTYTFLADYVPYASGDGMEHRNSTYIVDQTSLTEDGFGQISTLSHELFHAWNVERLRPAELEPFDFTRANPTPSLWFAEGFTTYYGPLFVRRAGVSNVDAFLASMSGILETVLNGTGRRYGSPVEMSLRAPFLDAATSIDPSNAAIITNYYPYGAAIALALDLTLRRKGTASLDDMMRGLWQTHGVTEKPYRVQDLQAALGSAAGDPRFAQTFFERSIYGSALPDYRPLLAQAGLTLQRPKIRDAFVGKARLAARDGEWRLTSYPEPGSPLYIAGLSAGDRIVSVNGRPIGDADAWSKALTAMRPGRSVTIDVESLGSRKSVKLVPVANPKLEIVRDETIGKIPSAAQLAFRQRWLGPEGSMLPATPAE